MKGRESFQRQLSNYGFMKRDWNKHQAHYVHWNNKLRRGRPDLVPQVKRRPKDSTYQDSVQEEPPAPNPPAVPQSLGQLSSDDRIGVLEKELRMTKLELKAARNEVLEVRSELEEMRALVKQMSRERNGALSIRNGSPNSQVHTGLVEGAVGSQYPMDGGYSGGIHDGHAPELSIGAYNSGAQLRGVGPYTGPGTINPALLRFPVHHQLSVHHQLPVHHQLHQLPTHYQLPNNTTSLASSSRTPHRATGLPVAGVSFLMQDSMMDGASLTSYGQQQNAGASAGMQTFFPNVFVPSPTSQAPARPQNSNSNSPKTSSTRQPLGLSGVPPPQSPPTSSWTEYFSLCPSNSGHQ
ncbi:hypothetical protein FRC05_004058 [Tulasnella sp. 425]|nr:hypothetical protein FRC05_004058 [Tulasnella sp. 425]